MGQALTIAGVAVVCLYAGYLANDFAHLDRPRRSPDKRGDLVRLTARVRKLLRARCPWCEAVAERTGRPYRDVHYSFHG